MNTLEIDPEVLGCLRRFQELPTRCTVVGTSGLYIVDRIRSIDDPDEALAPFQAFAALDCRDGKTHRIPLSHIHTVEAIRPTGWPARSGRQAEAERFGAPRQAPCYVRKFAPAVSL